MRLIYPPYENQRQDDEVDIQTTIVAHAETIDEEHIPLPRQLGYPLNDPIHHQPHEGKGDEEGDRPPLEGRLLGRAVVVDQSHSR